MTGRPDELIPSIQAAKAPSGRLDSPVPKMASTTAVAPSSLRSLETLMPILRSAFISRSAASRRRMGSRQKTPASLPQRWRCRAAASPSPALLPTPHTTAVPCGQKRATCQPAASMSQSTEMAKRSCASASTCLTWWLVRVGRALDDKGTVRVVSVDGVGLRDVRAKQPGHELRRDRADLGELERCVAERAVVDGDLRPLVGLGLLGQRSRPTDPGHDPAQLLVELETVQGGVEGVRVPRRDPGKDLVQRLWAAHLLDLLEHHRGELPVALGEHRIGPVGEREEQGGPATPASHGVADD